MESKKIIQDYVESIIEMLTSWASAAGKFKLSTSAANTIVPIEFQKIVKLINFRINSFRTELRIQYEFYQELEKEYGLKQLSFSYLSKYAVLTHELTAALDAVKEIGEKYNNILTKFKEYNMDASKYIEVKNQKAIHRIMELDVEKLLDILNDNDLLGF